MTGETRHLKVKKGRFYARMAVPAALRKIVGKSELVTALGGDRRAALKLLPEAVAAFHRRLNEAQPQQPTHRSQSSLGHRNLSVEQLAVRSYKYRLEQDRVLRDASPAWASVPVDTDHASLLREGMAGKLPDQGLVELVGNRISGFRARGDTNVMDGSDDWRRLAIAMCASEYEALERVFERDEGNFGGQPRHPVLQTLDEPEKTASADLMDLWDQYVSKRQKEGSMLDGGRRQVLAVKSLIAFTKKTNANDLTKKDIFLWQEDILTKMSPRTIAKVYLPTIRSLFRWAGRCCATHA
ncbi:MAG: DUF6538 domain-containing protein [Paracoccaceae bacterium]